MRDRLARTELEANEPSFPQPVGEPGDASRIWSPPFRKAKHRKQTLAHAKATFGVS